MNLVSCKLISRLDGRFLGSANVYMEEGAYLSDVKLVSSLPTRGTDTFSSRGGTAGVSCRGGIAGGPCRGGAGGPCRGSTAGVSCEVDNARLCCSGIPGGYSGDPSDTTSEVTSSVGSDTNANSRMNVSFCSLVSRSSEGGAATKRRALDTAGDSDETGVRLECSASHKSKTGVGLGSTYDEYTTFNTAMSASTVSVKEINNAFTCSDGISESETTASATVKSGLASSVSSAVSSKNSAWSSTRIEKGDHEHVSFSSTKDDIFRQGQYDPMSIESEPKGEVEDVTKFEEEIKVDNSFSSSTWQSQRASLFEEFFLPVSEDQSSLPRKRRRLQCKLCKESGVTAMVQLVGRSAHMRRHHLPEEECDECGKMIRPINLFDHKKQCGRDFPPSRVECVQCGKSMLKRSLYQHIKLKHRQ